MNLAINMHEYGRGEKCVYKLTYTYALITKKGNAEGKGEKAYE